MQDLTGQKFHCLTVTGIEKTMSGAQWICRCSCGKDAYAKTYDLLNDKKKSCGHLRTAHNKAFSERKRKHWEAVSKTLKTGGSCGWSIDESLDELGGMSW